MDRRTDLRELPHESRAAARATDTGEVEWPVAEAIAAVNALAHAGHLVLGLDLREYENDGRFLEVPWSSFDAQGDPEPAREAAVSALGRIEDSSLPLDLAHLAVLITWR
jgi:hypothetical protein